MTTGDLDAARDHLLASRQVRPRRDAAGRSADLINQAALELRADDVAAARGTLTQALDVAEDSADVGAQAHAHELLGIVGWRSGHPNRASREWAQARDLYEQAGDVDGQARCLQHQGTALFAEPDGDRRKAASLLAASLDLRADQQFGVGVALAHLYLAEQAADSARLSDLAEHRAAGLSALQSWTSAATEPAEVTRTRKRLTELGRGVLSR
jgi:tetratricopeptide (TPR) repeat protein